jgi:hypothetical protein
LSNSKLFVQELEALQAGEEIKEGAALSMTNTRHSALGVSLWTWALEQANTAMSSRDWKDAYKHLAVLQFAMDKRDFWLGDTEFPESNQEVLDELAAAWEKLLHTDPKRWTSRPENVDAWKAALRHFCEKLKGYEAGDSPPYHMKIKGVTE